MQPIDEMTLDELNAALREADTRTVEGIDLACRILARMKELKRFHPVMRTAILRWFDEVASGKLSARAVFYLGGKTGFVKAILPLDLAEQDRLALDAEVPVVERNMHGQIVNATSTLLRMDEPTLRRVFGENGIRSREEQERLLLEDEKKGPAILAPGNRLKVDTKHRQIIAGRMKISLDELRPALKELGFRMVKAPGEKAR